MLCVPGMHVVRRFLIQSMALEAQAPASLMRVAAVFWAALVARFAYVVWWRGPFHSLENDWGRHWQNAQHLFGAPTLMGGIDPKFYQLWLWLLQQLSLGFEAPVVVMTGLLCAIMPYFWYLAAREVFAPKVALACGFVVALCPSFLVIYSYFMNETLLLAVMGMALWLTLKAHRTGADRDYMLAVLLWVLAVHTRMAALPPAVVGVVWLACSHGQVWKRLKVAALVLLMVSVPAGWHAYRSLGAVAPFQFGVLNQIYVHNGSTHHRYYVAGGPYAGNYEWISPSYYANPFDPIGEFKTYRHYERPPVVIHYQSAAEDFANELALLKDEYTVHDRIRDLYENTVFLVLGPSWPDATMQEEWLYRLNYHQRWVWAVLMVALAMVGPCMPLRERRAVLVAMTLALMLALAVQPVGIMEGRYRKPLEPLLLLAVVALAHGMRGRVLEVAYFTPLMFARELLVRLWKRS